MTFTSTPSRRRDLHVGEDLEQVRGMNGRRSPGSISIAPSRPGSPSSAASFDAVALAVDGLLALERGVQEGVSRAERHASHRGSARRARGPDGGSRRSSGSSRIPSAPTSRTGCRRGSRRGSSPAFHEKPLWRAADARLHGSRDHLIERRIAGHRVGQLARRLRDRRSPARSTSRRGCLRCSPHRRSCAGDTSTSRPPPD